MKCLTLISVVIIGLLSMNSATAEGDDEGNVPRPRVGGVVAPGVIAPGALRAVTSVTHLGPISCPASDTSADGRTVCSNTAAYAFNSDAPDIVYALKVQAPAAHCAPVVYSVIVGNRTSVLSSRALSGGESQFIELGSGWSRGRHQVRIGAMAQSGQGCNTRGLNSWSVDVSTAIVPR